MMWHETYDKLLGENLWIDTSLRVFSGLGKDFAVKMLNKHDSCRILFASDCPWDSAGKTFDYIDSLPVSDDLKDRIYYANAEALLKIHN